MVKANLLLYLFGVVLLAISAILWLNYSGGKGSPPLYLAVNKSFRIENFLNSESYEFYQKKVQLEPDHITALFVITSDVCSPCINKVISYNYIFEKISIDNIPVQQLVVVLDSDKKRASRFVKTTEFMTPVAFGYDREYASLLQNFGETNVTQQLLLIDNNRKRVFFRIYLRQGVITEPYEKQEILNQAEKSFRASTLN